MPLVSTWLREHVVLKDDTFLGLLLLGVDETRDFAVVGVTDAASMESNLGALR